MANEEPKCIKCGGAMEEGFLLDRAAGGAGIPGEWVDGEPEKSIWTGTKFSDKLRYRIRSYRCRKCGYLESYAS